MFRKLVAILTVMSGLTFLVAGFFNLQFMGDIRHELGKGNSEIAPMAEPNSYHLGLVIPDVSDSFFDDLIQGIESSAPEMGAVVQVFRYSGNFGQEGLNYFEICLRSGLDGVILFIPRNETAQGLQETAAAAGVVLVTVGLDRPKGNSGGYIGSSSLQQGFEAGKIVAGKLGNNSRIGVLLAPSFGDDPVQDPFYLGVASALSVYGQARITLPLRIPSGPFSGEEAASSLLEKDGKINALVCSTAFDTEGAAQVVLDRNLVGRVIIVGADETDSIRRYLSKGIVTASILRDSHKIGEEVIKEFRRRKEGSPPSPPREIGFRVTRGKEVAP